jgi:HemY protein
MFFRLLILLLSLLAAMYFGTNVILSTRGESVIECHSAIVILLIAIVYFLYLCLQFLCRKFISLFSSGKTKSENGIDNLQKAFSAILLKDKKLAEECLAKAKKYLGPIPLVSWLEGQLKIQLDDIHAAKAMFYSLCEKEKGTVLGAYSLCQLAMKDGSRRDAINSIDAIIRIHPHSPELLLKAIAISIRSREFSAARKYMTHLSKFTKAIQSVSAVINHEEGAHKGNPKLLHKAFELNPGLTCNAICLADHLMAEGEYQEARYVLSKSFQQSPHPDVFDKYVFCGEDISGLDAINLAKKIIKKAPDSWIGYYGLAKLALTEKMFPLAFQNFLLAHRHGSYDFIVEKLKETAALLKDPKSPEVLEILATPLPSKHVDFTWKCRRCGNRESEWMPLCGSCDAVAEFVYGEEEKSFSIHNAPYPTLLQ